MGGWFLGGCCDALAVGSIQHLPPLRRTAYMGAGTGFHALRSVRLDQQRSACGVMASRKPDISGHWDALSKRGRLAVIAMDDQSRVRVPSAYHLDGSVLAEILSDLDGSGFDVARGVVFRGVPVRACLR